MVGMEKKEKKLLQYSQHNWNYLSLSITIEHFPSKASDTHKSGGFHRTTPGRVKYTQYERPSHI